MTNILKISAILYSALFLSSCGTLHTDCTTLTGDRDAYRDCMATQGNQVAEFELGMAAYEGEDYDTAIKWFKRAARPRSSQGPMYLEDPARSRSERVFEEEIRPGLPGHNTAQRMLVKIYEEGIGVPVNVREAERYREMLSPQ